MLEGIPQRRGLNPESLLAARVEGLVAQEHGAWVAHCDEAAKRIGGVE